MNNDRICHRTAQQGARENAGHRPAVRTTLASDATSGEWVADPSAGLGRSWACRSIAVSEAGRIRGLEWARENATASELQRLEELRNDWLGLANQRLCDTFDWSPYEDLEEKICGDDAELISLFDEHTFRAAFVEAAVEVWHTGQHRMLQASQ